MNRVIFVSQGGKTSTKTYDANGNQLTATDWLGNTVTYVYDGLNRLVEKRDAFDLPQETYTYDESSRQISAKDVYGRETTYEYDRNNRLVRTTAPDGYTVAQTYDRRGNVISTTDALGNTTHYTYDFLGRLVSVTDALSQSTTFTYDLKGNLLSQTDSAGNTTYLEYNCRDLLLRKVSPGGRTGEPGAYIYDPTAVISYTYDALGNTLTRTDRNGNTTVFEWDVHGNLVSQAIGSNEISYTYDNNGNVLTTTDSLGTTTRVYDEFNRCVSKTVPFIGTSTYAYDITSGLPAGHVAETTTDPYGNQTLREYDRAGRLVRVTDTSVAASTHTVIYTYNDNGSVASVIYPDGAREDYTYTAGNLLETLTNTLSDGTILETYVYTYDLARNLLTKQDAKGTTAYTYDPLGRVLTVTEPSGKLTEYTFDAAGNRSTQTVTETGEDETVTIIRTSYAYDARNRLIQLQKHDISDPLVDPILLDVTDYTYDHSGNQLTTTRTTYTDGVAGTPVMLQSNTYDVWNQLIRTETENGTVVENAYNGDGRRVIKSVNGAATYYLYEYDKVILETNVFGDVTGRNVYGLNLLMRTVGVDTFYYMYNGHADVTALLTPEGTVAASYYYDAFGNILEQTGDVSNSILFAGYQYDKETGLYYLNARMYDPVTARFMQEDTFAGQPSDPLSLNLYTYCHNSPLMYFDPTGHYTEYVNQTQGNYDYHGMQLSFDSTQDNMAQRAARQAMENEYPGRAPSNPAEQAMINAGYGGDTFKFAPTVYKTVKVAVEVKEESNSWGSDPVFQKDYMSRSFNNRLCENNFSIKYNDGKIDYQYSLKEYNDYLRHSNNPFIKYTLGIAIRTADVNIDAAVGFYGAVENAGRSIGDYYFSSHTSDKAVEAARNEEISWDECYNILGEEEKTRRSIALGNLSGFYDVAVGAVSGILVTKEYIYNDSTILSNGAAKLISVKDEKLIEELSLNRDNYIQAKSLATVEIVLVTLACALGKSMAKTAAKKAVEQQAAAQRAAGTEIIGKPHGSKAHQRYIMDEVSKLEQSGNYSKIYINKSLKTAGLEGTQRPDITAIGNEGVPNYVVEVASPSQLTGTLKTNLINKYDLIKNNNPSLDGDIIYPEYK